jgi:hypothetical protein
MVRMKSSFRIGFVITASDEAALPNMDPAIAVLDRERFVGLQVRGITHYLSHLKYLRSS